MQLNQYIDHTLLKPEASSKDIIKICQEAIKYNFKSVCVNSCYAKLVSTQLKDSNVKTCCVVGFPLGAMSTQAKVYEAKKAIQDGAEEIDMVINIGALKEENYQYILEEIKEIRENVKSPKILKVIIETCLLTDQEKVKACNLAVEAKADYVKTSTGFNKAGATIKDVQLMKKTVNGKAKVKASGGIRDKQTCIEFIKAGADRIGASAGVEIVS